MSVPRYSSKTSEEPANAKAVQSGNKRKQRIAEDLRKNVEDLRKKCRTSVAKGNQ